METIKKSLIVQPTIELSWLMKQVYPLDAVYDVPEDVPEDVKTNKRYAGLSGFTIQEVADQLKADYGQVRAANAETGYAGNLV